MTFWNDDDGMACGSYRLEPKAGAHIRKAIETTANRLFTAARKEGRRDTATQYAADTFVQLSLSANESNSDATLVSQVIPAMSQKVNVDVSVVIDYEPLLRGYATEGERCEIVGKCALIPPNSS